MEKFILDLNDTNIITILDRALLISALKASSASKNPVLERALKFRYPSHR